MYGAFAMAAFLPPDTAPAGTTARTRRRPVTKRTNGIRARIALPEGPSQVRLDRLLRNEQRLGDLPVRAARRGDLGHAPLTRSQRVGAGAVGGAGPYADRREPYPRAAFSVRAPSASASSSGSPAAVRCPAARSVAPRSSSTRRDLVGLGYHEAARALGIGEGTLATPRVQGAPAGRRGAAGRMASELDRVGGAADGRENAASARGILAARPASLSRDNLTLTAPCVTNV